MELIAVILKSPTSAQRFESAKVLLNYGFAAYALVTADPPEPLHEIPVVLGEAASVKTRLEGDNTFLTTKAKASGIEVQIDLEEELAAPVEAGQQVGRMTVSSNGEALAVLPIVTQQAVPRLTYWQLFQRCLQMAFCGG